MPEARVAHLRRDPIATCFSNVRIRLAQGNEYTFDLDDLADRYLETERSMELWREAFDNRILTLEYEALTEDPRGQIARLLSFLELEPDEACLSFSGSRN